MADKKRLINANDFSCTNCRHNRTGKCDCWCDCGEQYSPDLTKLQIVDAVEVAHGRWVPMYKVDWLYGKEWLTNYICTECGQLHKKKSNYCPNCGAKMDKERK